jgi:DNA-binding PadR family transcriptional regulator
MAEQRLSDLELSILSLVSEGARYGGEIEALIDARRLRDWLTVGTASVYYILGRLEQQGLIVREPPANDDAAKSSYSISDAGCGVLRTAITDRLQQPPALATGLRLGLANMGALKPSQVYRALLGYRDALSAQLNATEQQWTRRQSESGSDDVSQALFTHAIAVMQAEQAWLETFLTDWRSRHPEVTRETDETPATLPHIPNPHEAPTQLHAPTVNPAKQMQKVRRPSRE